MEASGELRDLVLRAYEAQVQGDFLFYERYVSKMDGVLLIGTDPAEWCAGYAAIIRMMRAQLPQLRGFQLAAEGLEAFCEGTVGWANDRPMLKLPDGQEIHGRLTAVFHREDGEWKIVVWHSSLGVSNEESLGQELPIS